MWSQRGGATGQILNQTGNQVILCGQTRYPREYFLCKRYQCHHPKTLGSNAPQGDPDLLCGQKVILLSLYYRWHFEIRSEAVQTKCSKNGIWYTGVTWFSWGKTEFPECTTLQLATGRLSGGLSTELLGHAVPMLATYFTIMFLAHAASPDRYTLQASNGCIYCAYFGRYGRNLKALQHLLATYAKRKLKNYHMGVSRTWAQLLSFNAWMQLSVTPSAYLSQKCFKIVFLFGLKKKNILIWWCKQKNDVCFIIDLSPDVVTVMFEISQGGKLCCKPKSLGCILGRFRSPKIPAYTSE